MIMLISKLITEHYIYINLHAEQVITANYLENSQKGIEVNELNLTTILNVVEDLKKIPKAERNTLILDFNRLAFLQPNIKNHIIDLKKEGFSIVLLNVEKNLIESLGFDSIENQNNIADGSIYKKFYLFEENREDILALDLDIDKIFYNRFKEILIQYKATGPDVKHTSSFVYISSYIDIKKIITFERSFILFAIYKLALKISNEYLRDKKILPKLVCQSLNGAFITSILSTYLMLDVVIIDKIGPINKLYARPNKMIEEDREYIVISDLVCLGTEVKIVKNLIHFLGGKYLGSISLIKVETLHKNDIEKYNTTTAVFAIKKSNNRELGYKIYTNLEDVE